MKTYLAYFVCTFAGMTTGAFLARLWWKEIQEDLRKEIENLAKQAQEAINSTGDGFKDAYNLLAKRIEKAANALLGEE